MKRKALITSLLIILVLIGSYLAFVDRSSAVVIAYKSYKVTEKKMESIHKFDGEVIPNGVETLSFDPSKGMYELAVKKGDEVKKGQFLLKYNDSIIKLSVTEAESQKKLAEKEVTLLQKQIDTAKQKLQKDKNLSSPSEMIRASETEIQQLESQLEFKKFEVEKATQLIQINTEKLNALSVTSPVSGVIEGITKNTDEKSYMNGITLHTAGPLKVNGQLSEYELAHVKVGQDVTVTSKAAPGKNWTGKITEIGTVPLKNMDENNAVSNYRFIVTLDNNEELQTGFHVNVTSKSSEVSGTVIPRNSIVKKGDENIVFIVKDGKAKEQAVTVEFETEIEAKVSGVEKGDKIISNPQKILKDGIDVFIK